MIEILDELDVLTQAHLDLSILSLAGVPYGSVAAEHIERDQVTQVTLAPIVRTTRSSGGARHDYYDENGRLLSRTQVIDSVVQASGMVHFADYRSYLVKDGIIVGFALTGDRRGHLAHFAHLNSYDEFLAVFGSPDQVEEHWDTGELMSYSNHYWASRKMASWDCWDERLSLVNLGDYDANLCSVGRLPN
ncbi:hypothetical protein [Nocardia pseudobrasiliensis]|nr:hypothetical protein [Nocardia pseudobrasiliensis]